jgi:hypothetical protein
MKININSDRYTQFMAFLDNKFPGAEQNGAVRQRLHAIGLRKKNKITSSKNSLANRQVDVLQGIITADNHSITKVGLYFQLFALYNDNAHIVTMTPEYDADLKKLESLQIIISQGDSITLATPAPKTQKQAAEEEEAEEKAEASNAASSYNLRIKRKSKASKTASSDNPKKSRTDTHEIELLTATVKQLQENHAVLQSNQDKLIAMFTQQQAAYAAQQTSYNDLQMRFNQLEEKHTNQNNAPVSPSFFYGNRPSPLLFNSPVNLPPSPLTWSRSQPLLEDELQSQLPGQVDRLTP